MESFTHWLDPKVLLQQFGYVGLFIIVFAESGLFFGFFLPGDSLLLIAGVLAATGYLKIEILLPLIFAAAFLGDQVGYFSGKMFGRRFFARDSGWLFHKDRITDAEMFFDKHGKKAVVIARFVPIVRTFIPIVAGIARMPYGVFVVFNFIGALVWGIGITLAGYFLGGIPGIDRYLHYVIGAIIVVSVVPVFVHAFRRKT